MGITEIITSLFGGGLTGLLGSIVTHVADYKSKQLDAQMQTAKLANDVEMKKADAAIMAQEWAARTQITQIETSGASDVAASQAFAASYSLEPKQYSEGLKPSPSQAWLLFLLDFVRGSVRPALTLYLCILSTLIYLQARALIGHGLDAAESAGITKQVVHAILYLTTCSVLWYFGTRAPQK